MAEQEILPPEDKEEEAQIPVVYQLNINPLRITAAEIGAILNTLGIQIPVDVYNNLAPVLQPLFTRIQ